MAALVLVSLCAVGASQLSVSAAQGSSANAQAPLVGAAVGSGAPAAYPTDGTHVTLFMRNASDNALYVKTGTLNPDGSWTWSPSTYIGGVLTSAPTASSTSTGLIDVFVRGSDGAVWEITTSAAGSPLTPWGSIGGQIPVNTAPSACSWGTGRLDVFVNGTDGTLWHKWWDASKWWNWESLGGKLTSGPGATATVDKEIGVFVRGTDGGLYYKHWDGTVWSGWASLGGQIYAGTSPAATNWGPTRIDWFVMGTDQQLWHSWQSSGKTSGYESLGGTLTSSPGATSRSTGTIDVFVRGGSTDFAILWQKSYGGQYTGGWSDWMLIGGV